MIDFEPQPLTIEPGRPIDAASGLPTNAVTPNSTDNSLGPVSPAPPGPPDSRFGKIKDFYRSNKWYVWAIALGVVIIAVLGYFAFRPQRNHPTEQANVDVTIDGPETAPSGSEVVYKFIIQNNDRAKLTNLELELVYPDGMTWTSSTPNPENLSGTLYKVPDLDNGQNAVIIVKTSARGNINDQKELIARLHYRFSNFNSEFTKQVSKSLRLVASDVTLELSGPAQATNAGVVSYDITYKNGSDHDIDNARIQMTYPQGFSFATSDPQPNLGQNIWNIGSLKQGQEGKITFQGSFKSAQPGSSGTFTLAFLVLDNQGNFYTQATTTFTTTISSLPLVVTQEVEQATNNIVDPGDTLTFVIHYQNNAQVTATGVNVVASVDSKAVDLSTIKADGGADINNNTISWNAAAVSNFERLNPSESGTLRYSIDVRNPAVKDASKNVVINTTVKIKSNEYSTFLPGNDLTLKVSSPTSLTGAVALVSGPNPPQSAVATTYQVTLTLRNATNDYSDAVLTGFVGVDAKNFDIASITPGEKGNVTYDPSTGKLTWNVGTLAAHSGDINPARKLTFRIRYTPPNVSDTRTTLFKNISYRATDTFTNQTVNLKTDDLSTSSVPRQ